jgi:phosphate transport system permease protein
MLIAVPVGIGAAAYLAEIAPPKVREIGKPLVEMLAAIPSVAVGFLGIVLVGPWIATTFGLNSGLNALNGGILLAVMALPTIISVAEDAIGSVPRAHHEAAYAMGATRWQTLSRVTLPSAGSGVVAAVVLGMGRALGETMTVLMATGNAAIVPDSIFDSVRTITATIAIELGEVPYGSAHYFALFALGAVLFLMSLAVNLVAERMAAGRRRFGS